MPWRGERDAYRVWLSEVILQQTRVAQGEGYYRRFLAAFPTVHALAAAPADDVMALWQGLGYYSRARNLHRAAQRVVAEHAGAFPTGYAELLKLPGVGPYTAAAVASFSSGEDVAVVDGNVYRVLARVFGLDAPTDTPAGQRAFQALADRLLVRGRSPAYNQAIMDFGATVCTPRRPACPSCAFRQNCSAHAAGTVEALPVKSKRPERRRRRLEYLHLVAPGDEVLVRRRGAGDIWQGLYDLPVVEVADPGEPTEPQDQDAAAGALLAETFARLVPHATLATATAPARTQLTHQELVIRYWRYGVTAAGFGESPPEGMRWVGATELAGLGVPQPLKRYLSGGQLGLGV